MNKLMVLMLIACVGFISPAFAAIEDEAHVSGDSGNVVLVRRADTAASSAGTDGDYAVLNTDSSGRLWVNIGDLTPGVAAGSLGKAEDAVHASADTGVAILTRRIDTAATSAGTTGDYATLDSDASGRLWTNVAAWTAATGATSLTKDEDVAETTGDDGVLIFSVRRDAAASSAGTTGDYATLNTDATGNLYTTGGANLTFGTTTYTEAATTGKLDGAVRNDTLAALADTDNEIAPLQVDALGALYVIDRAVAVLGTATYTETTSLGQVVGVVRNDVLATLANTDNEVTPVQVDANGAVYVNINPFGLVEGGLTELIGINEQIDQNDYSGSIGVALAATESGTIKQITFITTEDGTGDVENPVGTLFILDADPAVAAGDTAITAGEGVTVIAIIDTVAADWREDTAAGLYTLTLPGDGIAFHSLANLYFCFKNRDASAFNSDAAHDEQLEFNFWYTRNQ